MLLGSPTRDNAPSWSCAAVAPNYDGVVGEAMDDYRHLPMLPNADEPWVSREAHDMQCHPAASRPGGGGEAVRPDRSARHREVGEE